MDSPCFDRVAEVFEGARTLPKEERSAFLEHECAGQAPLRREVDSLLAEYGESDTELEAIVPAAALRHLAEGIGGEAAGHGLPPIEVPGFQILSLIGEGGHGVVYQAEQHEPRRQVALKLLRPSLGGSNLEQRFERETRVLARLHHPGIATILASGMVESAFGRLPYFAMELVSGLPLTESCKQRQLTTGERVALLIEVCDAIAHAHSKGVIHRDIKPSNVLVDEEGRARVLDFGVARVMHADHEASTLETRTGQIIGTLAYMSPEQARGHSDDIDEQTDVFAVGVLAFELLAGELPRDLAGRPVAEQLRLLADGETTLLGRVDRSLRGDLETIVAKAMSQEKAQRYASVTSLAADLRRYLQNEPILARRSTLLYQLNRFVNRNRALSISLGALMLSLSAGILGSLALYWNAQLNEEEALWQSYVANLTAAGMQLDAGTGGVATRLEKCPELYKDSWEWRYLQRHSDTSLTQVDSESMIHKISLGGSGILASGGGRELPGDYGRPDFRVFLWQLDADTAEIKFIRSLEPAHRNAVRGLAFGSGGDELVSLSRALESELPGEVHLWRASDGSRLASLDCQTLGLLPTTLAWLPNQPGKETGPRIAIGSETGVHLWEPSNQSITPLLQTKMVSSLARGEGSQSSLLFVGDEDGSVGIWDLSRPAEAAWRARVDLSAHVSSDAESYTLGVSALAIAPEGGRFLAGLEGGVLVLANIEGEIEGFLRGHSRTVTDVRWSADGRSAWSTSLDKSLRRWDLERMQSVEVRHGHAGYITSLDGTVDQSLLVTGAYDQTLRVWDTKNAAPVLRARQKLRSGQAYSLAFNGVGDKLAWRPEIFELAVSDTDTMSTSFRLPAFEVTDSIYPLKYGGLIAGVRFSSDDRSLDVIHGHDGQLRRFDANTGELLATLGPKLPAIQFVGFSHDGARYAASVDIDGAWFIQIYNLATGELEPGCSWPTNSSSPTLNFTPDDSSLVHTDNNSIVVRDAFSGKIKQRLELPHRAWHAACSPDGKYLAAISYDPDDRSLYIFDYDSGERRTLEGNVKPFCLTFMPGTSRIVTGNRDDGTVSLWDLKRGLTLTLTDLQGSIQWVAVSPDGRRIAAVDSAGVHRIWDAGPFENRSDSH